MVGAGGFEPPKHYAADLQSVPIGHSGKLPYSIFPLQSRWLLDYYNKDILKKQALFSKKLFYRVPTTMFFKTFLFCDLLALNSHLDFSRRAMYNKYVVVYVSVAQLDRAHAS